MSADPVNFRIRDTFGHTERLAAYFDFNVLGDLVHNPDPSSSDESRTGVYYDNSSMYTGYLGNQEPAFDTSKYTGYLVHTDGSSESESLTKMATAIPLEGGLKLSESNLQFETTDLNFNNFAFVLDFEFTGIVTDGILFGSFEKTEENIYDLGYQTGSKGFNVGVTSRGNLFVQTYGSNKDQIAICSAELAKRNVVGVSSYGSSIVLSHFDYFNDKIKSVEMDTEQNFLVSPDRFYFGASEKYFRSDNIRTKTFSGILNELAIFSGVVSPQYLKSVGSGFLGEYTFTAATTETTQRVTGYSESIVYRTGVTGYDYYETGTLTISTGREYFTGVSLTSDSSESFKEGEKYYKYYTMNTLLSGVSSELFYKEELGYLSPNESERYYYAPTGSGAYATLGLQDISESIANGIITNYTGQDSTSISLYGSRALTGTLNEISGVQLNELTEPVVTTLTEASSGIQLTGRADDFKMNYSYYDGERLL